MKVIIAGSRDIIDMDELKNAINDSEFDITEVVCGGARGVDELGLIWGTNNDKPVKMFKADWHKFGKKAGIRRNIEMGKYADALIALWDGNSRGTDHMIRCAKMQELKVHVRIVK